SVTTRCVRPWSFTATSPRRWNRTPRPASKRCSDEAPHRPSSVPYRANRQRPRSAHLWRPREGGAPSQKQADRARARSARRLASALALRTAAPGAWRPQRLNYLAGLTNEPAQQATDESKEL